MSFYTVQGRNNYYTEFGGERLVLLLHGISNSGRAWGRRFQLWSKWVFGPLYRIMRGTVHQDV